MESANPGLQIVKLKIFQFSSFVLAFALVISGCTAYQVGSEIQAGRQALKYGDPKIALASFQRAAELDPDYLLNFSLLDEGVWTYVGRAHYATGNLPEARKALERARSRYDRDHLAKLYLGIVLARDGDRERGIKEMESGLRGLGDWLDYIDFNLNDGRFWDPSKNIRTEIQKNVAMISAKDINWPELIGSGERLGQQVEEEVDKVRLDKRRERRDDGRDKDSSRD
jgi:tetratricopeptide (TPR) repeat protein